MERTECIGFHDVRERGARRVASGKLCKRGGDQREQRRDQRSERWSVGGYGLLRGCWRVHVRDQRGRFRGSGFCFCKRREQ
ncbi:hypothetical protein AWB81_04191 [Caballeronia arationis]|nr:hypothetical protein AWB81_04191 [Caballeronia arationis]